MTLVVDASVVVPATLAADDFSALGSEQLLAPPLMWSEARSALHELLWRREIDRKEADEARSALEASPVERHDHRRLGTEAWRIADELGWAKTYDAEYVALASLLDCRLVTLDARLRRAAGRLGFVVSPAELRRDA